MNARSRHALGTARERLGHAGRALADALHSLIYALRELPKADPPADIVVDTRPFEDQVRDAFMVLPSAFKIGEDLPQFQTAETNAQRTARLLKARREPFHARAFADATHYLQHRRRYPYMFPDLYTGPAPDLEVVEWPPAPDGYHNPDLPR